MKSLTYGLCVVALLTCAESVRAMQGQNAAQGSPMTNQDVIKLVRAGLGEALIVQTIEQAVQPGFDTSSDGLVELKTSGVADTVIAAILRAKPVRASTPAAAVTPAPARTEPVSTAPSKAPTPSAGRAPTRLSDGVLDEITLYLDRPTARHVVVRPFSATDADLVKGEKKEETKIMQASGPRLLAERLVAKLKELGPFEGVDILEPGAPVPADAVVVEGKFTELDPGSRAKRYFVGFGSGKSGVSVSGSVTTSEGVLLATFEQHRIGVMGIAGGDSLGKLNSDVKSIGEDIAKFMNAWGTGKKLK